jgi:hypothetical protein
MWTSSGRWAQNLHARLDSLGARVWRHLLGGRVTATDVRAAALVLAALVARGQPSLMGWIT